MALSISQLQQDPGNVNFSSAHFRDLIESHLEWLSRSKNTLSKTIDGHLSYKYEGDFFGLCTAVGIPQDIQWPTMRLNGLHCPYDLIEVITLLHIPSVDDLNYLLGRQLTVTNLG